MSKRKHDDEGAEQPPFEEHSFEQVSETARMLYAERPFALDGDKDHEFDFLVSDAFDFLDKLHEPYARIAEWRRSATPETLKKFERERVRARQPFRRAVRIIFNDFTEKFARLRSKFEKRVLRARALADSSWLGTEEERRAKIARWKEQGMTLAEVFRVCAISDERQAKRARAKKRKPWTEERRRKTEASLRKRSARSLGALRERRFNRAGKEY